VNTIAYTSTSPAIPDLNQIPEELRNLDQWLIWKYQKDAKGKTTKVPYSPVDRSKCAPVPRYNRMWNTAEHAIAAAKKHGFDGVGFVFTEDDPYVGIDFDAAVEPTTGNVMEWAASLLNETTSYTELSVSGTGKHVICKGITSRSGTKANVPKAPEIQGKGPQIEIYSSGRYFVFTGEGAEALSVEEDQRFITMVEASVEKWKGGVPNSKSSTALPEPELSDELYEINLDPLNAEDKNLVDKLILREPAFRELWHGHMFRYGNNPSDADFALIRKLLQNTGWDRARAARIFTASKLADRDKWRDRPDYRRRTVEAAFRTRPSNSAVPYDQDKVRPPLLGEFIPADPIETETVEKFGPPFEISVRETKGSTKVKIGAVYEAYFAGLYSLKNKILWSTLEKRFYQYSAKTGIYTMVDTATIRETISQGMLAMARRDLSAMGITDTSALLSARKTRNLDAIVRHLEGIVGELDPFQPSGELRAHFANGVLVHKGRGNFVLEAFTPEIRSRNASPISYDPHAEAPRFLEMLSRGFQDEADVELVLAYIGQCIFGRNMTKRMLIISGLADNGKTTLVKLIQRLVGRGGYCELKPKKLDSSFEQARFMGRTLLTGADVSGDFLSNPGAQRLKALVGGDILNPESKGSNEVLEISGYFNVVIATNEKLTVTVNGDADAWQRRILPVTYNAPPPAKKIDEYELVLLRTEGSGILNLAAAAYGRLLNKMEEYGDVSLPIVMRNRIDSFLPEVEHLRIYLKAFLQAEKGSRIAKEDILDGYLEFAEQCGWEASASQTVRKELTMLIKEIFAVSESHSVHDDDDDKVVRGYRGLMFKSDSKAIDGDATLCESS